MTTHLSPYGSRHARNEKNVLLFGQERKKSLICIQNLIVMALRTRQSKLREKQESRMIFASSCIEASARQRNISTKEMYQRMKRVGLIDGFILKCYEGLHTQSRQHVTEDVLGALDVWEAKKAGQL